MSSVMEYRGYHTKIEYDAEDKVLHGKIEGISDLVNFESEDIEGIEGAFKEAVDDYLALCEELGVAADKEYKGSFNVRIKPELHKEAAIRAKMEDKSLNQYVAEAIERALNSNQNKVKLAK